MQQTSPHNPISSKGNSIIKYLRSLSDAKDRRKEQVFLIEGVKMVEDALRDTGGVTRVVASPSLVQHHGKGVLKLAESRSVEIVWISDKMMDVVAESKTPQPVMAIVSMKEVDESALLEPVPTLIVIAHQLQDPGNMGTIIRTCEAVGASGLAFTSNTVDPFSPKAIRASMGSILRLPVARTKDASAFIKLCKLKGLQTVAAVITGDKSHFDVDLRKPTALILGQEGAGLPQNIASDVDVQIRIPMAPSIDSLNVASSAAIILYEALRQRHHDKSYEKGRMS